MYILLVLAPESAFMVWAGIEARELAEVVKFDEDRLLD